MTERVEQDLRRSFMRGAYRRSDEAVSPISHVVGFWILLSAAALLFSASVFLPIWQEQQEVLTAQAEVKQRLDAYRAELAQLQATVRALDEDPTINQHTALRELNFRIPGQEVVPTHPSEAIETSPQASASDAQIGGHPWLSCLPRNWDRLNAWAEWASDPGVRRALLVAAAFLASTAFVLCAPPTPKPLRLVRSKRSP